MAFSSALAVHCVDYICNVEAIYFRLVLVLDAVGKLENADSTKFKPIIGGINLYVAI